jgi:hypothetical protein
MTSHEFAEPPAEPALQILEREITGGDTSEPHSIFSVYDTALGEMAESVSRNPDGSVTRARSYLTYSTAEQFTGAGVLESRITFYPSVDESGIERVETTYLEYDGQVIGIDNKGDSYKIAPDGERTPLNGGDEEIPLSSLAEAAIKLTDDLTMGVSVDPLLPLESYLLQCE